MKSLQLFNMGVDSSCSILVLPTLRIGFRYICIWNLSYLAWDLPLKMAAIIQICMIAAFTMKMKSGIFAHPFDIGLLFDIHNLCRFFPEKATTLATDILNELVQVSSVFRLTYLNNS